ncbi:MAG TPA: hypothetical protein VLT58_04300 [Polyangia bacterium]|nr:hypothetical protein [Polyangia bacterium]
MARRWSLALGLSLLAHVVVVVAALGVGTRPFQGTVDVEITGLDTAQVTDLPLGGPPPGGGGPARTPRRAHHRAPRADEAELEAPRADDREQSGQARGEQDTGGPAPTDDLTAYGPRGSRLTVLLRLDRLRTSDLAPGIDALLARLPDHRDLLDGTGLDLFRSFDALLIATPHPLDPTVTFLAVRHHLEDGAFRRALNDGAAATNRGITWHADRGRWIGERRALRGKSAPGFSRDDRLIVLAAPGLAVVTPPAYRALLLDHAAAKVAVPAADGGAEADGDSDAGSDGGRGGPASIDWATLLSRIDAEEGLMPPDGDVLMSAVDIFKARGGEAPRIYGMELPAAARAVAGMVGDESFLDVTATFATEADARHWEAEWPNVRDRLRGNPLVILGGFSPLLGRISLDRDGAAVRVHLTATHDEVLRLMGVALRFLGG